MRIAGYVSESLVDGPGVRLVVFFQGCSLRCAGCHNEETHDPSGGKEVTVDDVLANVTPLTTGITLSGGEPSDQPLDMCELIEKAHSRKLSVTVYTGLTLPGWIARFHHLVDKIDYIKVGPFRSELRDLTRPYCGSTNQRFYKVKDGVFSAI